MNKIILPNSYNYIGIFLTMRCSLSCSYCINNFGTVKKDWKELSGREWIKGLSRILTREDLPLSLQGGEPFLHPDFYPIITELGHEEKFMDVLTNGMFDSEKFERETYINTFRTTAKYAGIRFSFHQNTNMIGLAIKVWGLVRNGYSCGIWGLKHPEMVERNAEMKDLCKWLGIDYREKEYLDFNYDGYKYPEAILGKEKKHVKCKPSEMLIAPDGSIYRCHSDLYSGRNQQGHILDKNVELATDFISCDNYGLCNPCDIKIKNSRFQIWGHTSVEIKDCIDKL
jgi:sulfatase maturation enzyme AslB (radical SAM superfamily)